MPTPASNEDFLIRARELAAAQRFALLPPPGKISRELVARALGMSHHTARRLEQSAALKLRHALEKDGLTRQQINRLLSPLADS